MVNAALALLWQYLNNEDDLVYACITCCSSSVFACLDMCLPNRYSRSEEVLPLAKCYVDKIQGDNELIDQDKEHLGKMLTILANKMKYDSSFDFAQPGQIEQEFLQYRKVSARSWFKSTWFNPLLKIAFIGAEQHLSQDH